METGKNIPRDSIRFLFCTNQDQRSMACVAEPYCILLPRNASDISKILRIFEYLKIRFAVRSEGHAPNPGWSSVDSSGILVSLERLNQVTLSDDKSTASLGPGGRWGDVNATLSSSRIAVLGGRASNVGVGGLLLGGMMESLRHIVRGSLLMFHRWL